MFPASIASFASIFARKVLTHYRAPLGFALIPGMGVFAFRVIRRGDTRPVSPGVARSQSSRPVFRAVWRNGFPTVRGDPSAKTVYA